MGLDLILKDIQDERVRENFFRIQRYIQDSVLLGTDFKFIEADVSQASFSFPIPHGLKYIPTDIIPLAAEGDYNYYFNEKSDEKNVYVAAHGPVRLRFLVGKIDQTGRRNLKESKVSFVAPNIGQVSGTLSGAGSDGWAFIQDGHYTVSSPMAVPANTRIVIPNDATGALTNYVNAPANASSWWDAVHYRFWPSKLGEFYTFRLNFQLVPSINNSSVFIDADIGTMNSPFAQTLPLSQGAGNINRFSIAIPTGVLSSAYTNGIGFHITCSSPCQLSNINLTVVRDFHL